MEEHFAIDEAFLATCTKPGLVEIVRANPEAFDAGLKPAGKTMTVLREWILAAAASGSLKGYVPRECRFGSAEQLERIQLSEVRDQKSDYEHRTADTL